MTRKIQPRVLYGSLDALAAFLHGGIRQTNDDHGGQSIAVIHFHFNNDAFKANDSTGKNSRKHERKFRRGELKSQTK
jgi:hypothetical protein